MFHDSFIQYIQNIQQSLTISLDCNVANFKTVSIELRNVSSGRPRLSQRCSGARWKKGRGEPNKDQRRLDRIGVLACIKVTGFRGGRCALASPGTGAVE